MQLISLPVSPFAARVRIAIYAKHLPIALVPPPAGWPRNPAFRQINPTGRIPVLILDDGEVMGESTIILEFLEDQYPDARALLPSSPFERAKVRHMVRLADLYLMPPMVSLAEARREQRATVSFVEALLEGLQMLDDFLDEGAYAFGDQLTLADCALGPVLFAVEVTGSRLGLDLLETAPRVARYRQTLRRDEHVGRVIDEMEEGLRQLAR